MARFRYSGVNWEGRAWKVSAPIEALGRQIEARWPDRHPADGTVASQNHDAWNPRSDHRPDPYTGPGIVRALDAGETVEGDGEVLAEALRAGRDPRVRYVIHEGRLFSSYDHANGPAWSWRPYTGGGHRDHVHVSVLATVDAQGQPWVLGGLEDDMALTAREEELVRELLRAWNASKTGGVEKEMLAIIEWRRAQVRAGTGAGEVTGRVVSGTFSGEIQAP